MLCSLVSLRAIKSSLLAVCLCMAVSDLTSPAQQQDAPAALSEFTVRGTVIDAITKQPIARALVQSGSGDAILTDSNGSFEFADARPGQQTLIVRRPGYLTNQDQPEFQPSQNQFSSFSISIRADMPPLTLALTPEAIITGRLASPDSDPEDGTQVFAYRKSVENGRPKWKMAGIGTSDSEGIFRIASLSAGTYLLYTQPLHAPLPNFFYAAPEDAPTSGYPPVYYPGVTDASAASAIMLAPGEHKQADITLLRQTFYPVTIRVTNIPPGYPFNVQIADAGGKPVQSPVHMDSLQQAHHTHLPPGRYLLMANVFDNSNARTPLYGRAEFTVTTAPANLGITVVPLRTIPVTIRREFTASVPGITIVSGNFRQQQVAVFLNFVSAGGELFEGGNYGGGLEPVPGSNDDSSYQISNIPPGKYWVEANTFQSYYISSITSGGVDLTHNVLNLSGGSSAPIEITLRNDTGSIEVTFTNTQSPADGEAHQTVHQIWIYAIPLFNTVSSLRTINLGISSGKTSFSMLAPGAYRVIASDKPLEIAYHDPETLAALSNKGQVVTVEPGAEAHVQLDITPAAEPSQ